MDKVCWLIDDILLERHDDVGFPNMVDAAKEAGHEVIQTKYVPFSNEFSMNLEWDIYEKANWEGIPLITYGCIGFLKQFKRTSSRKNWNCPGSYFKIENLTFSKCASVYTDYIINNDFIMLPYSEVKRRYKSLFGDRFFMRSNAVTKTLPGRVFDFSTVEDRPEALFHYQTISDDEIVVVSSEKNIKGEYRHVICDNELIAQSQYRWEGKLDIRIDVYPECQRLAKEISRNEWQPDYVYVVDTAILDDGTVGIMEFNSFSCSGLYACDTRMIIERVSQMAWKEFNADF